MSLIVKKSNSNWTEGKRIEIYPTGFPKSKRTSSTDQNVYFGQKKSTEKNNNENCDIMVNLIDNYV